jgi:hypothetical protein
VILCRPVEDFIPITLWVCQMGNRVLFRVVDEQAAPDDGYERGGGDDENGEEDHLPPRTNLSRMANRDAQKPCAGASAVGATAIDP